MASPEDSESMRGSSSVLTLKPCRLRLPLAALLSSKVKPRHISHSAHSTASQMEEETISFSGCGAEHLDAGSWSTTLRAHTFDTFSVQLAISVVAPEWASGHLQIEKNKEREIKYEESCNYAVMRCSYHTLYHWEFVGCDQYLKQDIIII